MRIKVNGEAERAAQPALVALSIWLARMGIASTTCWRWRQKGWLKTTNICGKLYVASEDDAEFTRRAKDGEFAQAPQTPQRLKVAA